MVAQAGESEPARMSRTPLKTDEVLAAQTPSVVIVTPSSDDSVLTAKAAALARELALPVVAAEAEHDAEMALAVSEEGLELRILRGEEGLRGGRPLRVDWSGLDVLSGPGRSLKQPLAKALGLRRRKRRSGDGPQGAKAAAPLRVLDASAGLGEDAWLMAGLGCHVLAVERCGVLAAMLADGLRRAAARWPEIAGRLRVAHSDAGEVLKKLTPVVGGAGGHPTEAVAATASVGLGEGQVFDVVYLDPMFPGAEDRSAAQRKPLRILRRLVGEDADADALLPLALAVAKSRVVVKRPPQAPVLAGREPTLRFAGKGVRWDVYVRTVLRDEE